MNASSHRQIRQLLDDYLRMYAERDDQLTTHFSENFSGFTGSGDFLVKDRAEWVAITRQDFAQIKDPIRIELKDVAIQSLSETAAVATSFFTIHLPIPDHFLSRETARLVLIFTQETAGWKIAHSSISIPYHAAGTGEVYPLKELTERNQRLEELVTERTALLSAANAALHESEDLYRSILNAYPDDITIADMEGRIRMISPAAAPMFGFDGVEEGIGRLVTDFLSPEDRPRAAANFGQNLQRQGNLAGPNEYRGLRRDGSTFDIEVNREFIRDAQGVPTGMVFVVRDITRRKRAEAEKEKLEAQNRQLQKAESLGRMAGAIAHHFNNQLHAVMLGLELTMSKQPQNVELIDDLTEIMQAARNAAKVSSRLLTYLGQSLVNRDLVDLSEACHSGLDLLRTVIPSTALLETHFPSPGPVVNADVNQLQQALTNLVSNAWEACGDRAGTIRLTVKSVSGAECSAKNRFPIDSQPQDAPYACIEVADTGRGIAEDDIEKIFDPFFSTKFAGRGLGLPVILGIVRSLDGFVTVESELNRGSVFRVLLPQSSETVTRKPVAVSPAPRTVGSGTVLVIDDEQIVRSMVTLMLKRQGYTVLTASDGVEGVEIFRQHQNEIDCVLCDLTMPRMDGWATLAALRQRVPGLPLILSSGYSEGQVMQGDHAEMPTAFLRKPYQRAALAAAISDVCRRKV